MAITAPNETSRWRCSQCGNLTRFDVVRSMKAQQYWHFDLAGDHSVESEQALYDDIESVTCRWCGTSDAIEIVPRASDG